MKKIIAIAPNALNITGIEIDLYYHIGGDQYPNARERGYYLRVSPVNRVNRDGYIIDTYDYRYTAYRYLIKTVARKSAKAENDARERVNKLLQKTIEHVCFNNNIPAPAENITL